METKKSQPPGNQYGDLLPHACPPINLISGIGQKRHHHA
jgi:hypothetical protein